MQLLISEDMVQIAWSDSFGNHWNAEMVGADVLATPAVKAHVNALIAWANNVEVPKLTADLNRWETAQELDRQADALRRRAGEIRGG